MQFAIHHKHPRMAQAVLAAGCDVTIQKNPDLNTALHQACAIGAKDLVVNILKLKDQVKTQGVDQHEWNMLEAANLYGHTPLHTAAQTGSIDCIELLLDAGADVNAKNGDGSIPLHFACYNDHDNEVAIEKLIKAGSDVNALDNFDTTPLMVAAKKNQVKNTTVLLNAGADRTLTDEHGNDALYYAKQKDYGKVIEALSL